MSRNEALHFTEARVQLIFNRYKRPQGHPQGAGEVGGEALRPRQRLDHIRVICRRYREFPDFVCSTWTVPPAPSTDSGQTIFLFNGIQNYGTNYGILQPVLQWGPSAAGGGSYWSIASWYVTSGGDAFHTTLIQVDEGDVLIGLMTFTGQPGRRSTTAPSFKESAARH